MSRDDMQDQDPENLNEELLEGEEGEEEQKEPNGAGGWFISVGVHLLFALIFWYVVFGIKEAETELPPLKVTTIDPPPKKEEKRELQRDVDQKVEINIENVADVAAPINNLNTPLEEKTQSEEDTEAEMNKGREEAVAASEMGNTGAFMAIGAGGGSAGMFGSRTGGGKRRALAKGGGSRASESAVDAALRWFKRHQSPNGMWDTERYPANCQENPKCEPGNASSAGGSDANVAMTGYAVLCFLGAGYDHKTPNKYKTTVQKGLEYLRATQKGEGVIGVRNYEHAVATMALAEAYAMTNDPDLKEPAQKGLKVILARQAKDSKGDAAYNGLAWDYEAPKPERNDASVSGWCVMALKSGMAGGLNVGTAMEGAKKWLERHWKATNKDWQKLTDPYSATSTFAYTWDATNDNVELGQPGQSHDLAPVGALCAVFLGHHGGDIMLESLCNHIMKHQFPATYPCNTYFMYYNTLAIFQAGGDRWTKWNGTVRDMLVNAQRKGEGCFDGSWNFEGTQFHGHECGRILSTAYCCLSLEVYYRYKQVGGADAKK